MAISSRQAGAIVDCPTCGEKTLVPQEDSFSAERALRESAPQESVRSELPPVPPPIPQRPRSDEEFIDDRVPEAKSLPSPVPAVAALDEPVGELFVPAEFGGDDEQEGPLTIRRRGNIEDEMDLTPMVDVTFQLLIFFMVSASFSLQKTIEVPIPDPDQKGATQQVQTLDDLQGTSILVRIDAGNSIWIDDEPLGDVNRLADTLRDKMRREQKTELLVTADSQSLHRSTIAVIDAANEVGMQKIRMGSKKKGD